MLLINLRSTIQLIIWTLYVELPQLIRNHSVLSILSPLASCLGAAIHSEMVLLHSGPFEVLPYDLVGKAACGIALITDATEYLTIVSTVSLVYLV